MTVDISWLKPAWSHSKAYLKKKKIFSKFAELHSMSFFFYQTSTAAVLYIVYADCNDCMCKHRLLWYYISINDIVIQECNTSYCSWHCRIQELQWPNIRLPRKNLIAISWQTICLNNIYITYILLLYFIFMLDSLSLNMPVCNNADIHLFRKTYVVRTLL